MSTRPSFGQWLKHTWLDIVTMVVMGAIGLGVGHKIDAVLNASSRLHLHDATTDIRH